MRNLSLHVLIALAILVAGVITIYQANQAVKYYDWVGKFGTVFVVHNDNPANCLLDNACTPSLVDTQVVLSRQYKYATVLYAVEPRWIKEGVGYVELEKFIETYPVP